MGLKLHSAAVSARQRANRLVQDVVTFLAADLKDADPGTVVPSGIVYAADKKGTAGSDGYAYREAVGMALGHGVPVKDQGYPLASLVRPVSMILPLLDAAAIEDIPALSDDATKEDKATHAAATKDALAQVPAAYRTAPADAVTWLLAVKDLG